MVLGAAGLRHLAAALMTLGVAGRVDAQRSPFFGRAQSDGPRPLMYGFALECTNCESARPNGAFGRGPLAVWKYSEYPRVAAVTVRGPAEIAGIRANDVVVAIDGHSLLTDDGSRRFSAAHASDQVRLTLERDHKQFDVTLTLGLAGRGFGPDGQKVKDWCVKKLDVKCSTDSLVYAGHAGTTRVEVVGDEPVVASTDSTGALVLHVGGSTIRIRPEPSKKP